MNDVIETQTFCLFLFFCRIGGCILVSPGFSSLRIPVHIRLFLAFGVTAALAPLMFNETTQILSRIDQDKWDFLILKETAIGALIGLLARCFFYALQFSVTAIANFIGLAGIPGISLDDAESGSPLATLVSSAAVTVVFIMGMHVELLKALIESYSVFPLDSFVRPNIFASSLLKTLNETWLVGLRLTGPFLVYGVVVNFALGLGNRFAQQISMYHASTGIVMLGGFLLFYLLWNDFILLFTDSYRSWLVEGGF